MRLGIVGCGYWGPNLVRNFARAANAEVALLCDLSEAQLRKMSTFSPSAEVTSDYHRVVTDPTLQAVVIATPARLHYEMALAALEAGKHVYVEKPLCLNSRDARELVGFAEARGRTLMVGHLLEYHPAVDYLRGLIERGELGDLRYIYSQRLNLGQVRRDENALWSLAPHDISVANLLIGTSPVAVTATGQAFLRPEIQDVVFITLEYPEGRMAHIHVSWLDPHKTRQFTVVGSRRMATFDDMEPAEKIRIYDKGVDSEGTPDAGPEIGMRIRFGDVLIPWLPTTEPLLLECQHFIDAVRQGRTPRSDGWDGLRVVEILEAADRSLQTGTRVQLTPAKSRPQ